MIAAPLALLIVLCGPAVAEENPPEMDSLMPSLSVRYPPGPDGLSLTHLIVNLDHTSKNIKDLVDYLVPWQEGFRPPKGEAAASARKTLAAESAAADKLIAAADAALLKGIPRDPQPPPRTDGLIVGTPGDLPLHVLYRLLPRDPDRPEFEEMNAALVRANLAVRLRDTILHKRLANASTSTGALLEESVTLLRELRRMYGSKTPRP